MNSIVRITGMINKVNCANPLDCVEEIGQLLSESSVEDSDILLFPKLALCSPSCGNLFLNRMLTDQCSHGLRVLQQKTKELSGYVVVGLAIDDCGRAVSAMAVLHKGELIGLVPTMDNPSPFLNSGFSQQLLPLETVFTCGSMRFCVLACDPSTLAFRAAAAVQLGCDLILVPAYSPVYAGYIDEICQTAQVVSQSVGCAITVVNGGVGNTSSPYAYKGFVAVYECGKELVRKENSYQAFAVSTDLDTDIIRANKKLSNYTPSAHSIPLVNPDKGLLRQLSRTPFLPETDTGRYLTDLFDLQVCSLVSRMENTGINKLVLGISGGLDSTGALLVSAAAMDVLGLARDNIIGITMPGFGTTDRTYYNALSLLERLGVTRRDISIRQSVQQHFEDIGHSGEKDTTFENAQARERAQILLDVANSVSGLVVGTGDLSEEALGFCTFAGDHIANYNVNVCITKTVLRALVEHIAESGVMNGVADVLQDILETPVSPELLPPAESGEMKQKTEEILGPYELHDFFLYHFVKHHFHPVKLLYYACVAFTGSLEPAFIKDKLRLFFKRFAAGQFKRSCAPDAASISQVNLNGVNYYIPSDLDPSFLLQELDEISL